MGITDPSLVEGDGLAQLEVAFKRRDGETPLDLTNLTARVRFRVLSRADRSTILLATTEKDMTKQAPETAGVAVYQWLPAELVADTTSDDPAEWGGIMQWEAWGEDAQGRRLTVLIMGEEWIRAKIPGGT